MAKLIYVAISSLDGFMEDESGGFDWSVPDAEIHGFVNRLESNVGTHLYGRRMYETMAVWQTYGVESGSAEPSELSAEEVEFGEMWRGADKVVYSQTLTTVSTPRTQLESEFDPEAVRRMKEESDRDLSVSGPGLAEHAFAAGLVDEIGLVVFPVLLGGGKKSLPGGTRLDLELVDERRFQSGVVYLGYGVR